MSNEIEEFLRKAALRRAAQAKTAVGQHQPKVPPRTLRLGDPTIATAEIVEADVAPPSSSVSEHVARHLNTASFEQRASQFEAHTHEADVALQTHLRSTFDHKLSRLASEPQDTADEAGVVQAKPLTTAEEIQHIFRSPHSLRTAFLFSEIFHRPEHRW